MTMLVETSVSDKVKKRLLKAGINFTSFERDNGFTLFCFEDDFCEVKDKDEFGPIINAEANPYIQKLLGN